VFAFEPDPENFDLLLQNLATNNITNVEATRVALSNIEGHSYLTGRGLESHLSAFGTPVKTISIDLAMKERASILKMDIEGSEVAALEGSTLNLDSIRGVLIETHGTDEVVMNLLQRKGFDVGIVRVDPTVKLRYAASSDVVFDEIMTGFTASLGRARGLARSGFRKGWRLPFKMVFGTRWTRLDG
jgi:FkbM family methyltransferase